MLGGHWGGDHSDKGEFQSRINGGLEREPVGMTFDPRQISYAS